MTWGLCAGCGPAGSAVGLWCEVVGFKVVTAELVCGLASPVWTSPGASGQRPQHSWGWHLCSPQQGGSTPAGTSVLRSLPDKLLNEFSSEMVFGGL